MMPNPYLNQKLAQAHYQELLHEAEQQRMAAQLPQHQPHLMRNVAGRLAAFFINLSFSATKRVQPMRKVTGQL